ncbi:MAG: helicase-associated domain-containing protein [Streptosporangiales bacterium]
MGSHTTEFADWLRGRPDGELAALFTKRPDLLHPLPADCDRLAGAAASQVSLQLAVEQLDTLALRVLRALASASGPVPYARLVELMGAPTDGELPATVDELRARALAFGDDDHLTVPANLRRLPLLPHEHGPHLGSVLAELPPERLRSLLDDLGAGSMPRHEALASLEARFADPDFVCTLLDEVSTQAREALDRVAGSNGRGRVEGALRPVTRTTASSPVEELLARGLLVPLDDASVAIPAEVATVLAQRYVERPELKTRRLDPALADSTGGMRAHATVQAVADVLDAWANDPPARLRSGGLAVRDLRAASHTLDCSEREAAFVVELAHAANLVDATYPDGEWVPTKGYDAWRSEPVAERWAVLAQAWLDAPRAFGLVGRKDEKNKTINALGTEASMRTARSVRGATVDALGGLDPGAAPTTGSLNARLAWQRPRSGGQWRAQLVEWTVREAEQLGCTGQGALTAYGRKLLAGERAAAVDALEPCLPQLVDHVLLQPDLTAVAPGPLRADVRGELAMLADVESTGGATVYRFTKGSVRRALDAGRTAAEIHEWLAAHSRTGVPQPLAYLVDDLASRHGQLRVGGATSYLRSDDEATLGEIVADRRAQGLALRRIAPTVLVSHLGRTELLDGLREIGYAPVAESATGDVVVTSRRTARTEGRLRAPGPAAPGDEAPNARLLDQAVRVLRAGDRMAGSRTSTHRQAGDTLPRNPAGDTLAAVHRAIAAEGALWIGYANAEGRASLRLIEPVAVLGGLVEAYDHLRESRRTFALHRITGYATVDDAST